MEKKDKISVTAVNGIKPKKSHKPSDYDDPNYSRWPATLTGRMFEKELAQQRKKGKGRRTRRRKQNRSLKNK